jgi:hypothetical protein
LQLASLLCLSVCVAGPATSDGLLPALQQAKTQTARTPGLADSLMQSAFRPRNGTQAAKPRLDLRLPDNAKPLEGYPSAPERTGLGAGTQNSPNFQLPFAKARSPAEEFVNRVHHEGLPVARLWENKSALVSLGLNQKGQAGLWLIQKTQ